MRGCRDLSAVALALLTLTAASGAPGRPVQLGVLRLRGGVAPPIVQVDSEAAVARSAEEQAARRQRKLRLSSHHRLRRGRIGVFGCLYLFALLNGLARRSLSSAAPSLVELGHLDKARLDQLSSMGWEAFALGKLLVAPVLLALGPRMAAMLQIGIIVLASSAFCIWPGSASVQVLPERARAPGGKGRASAAPPCVRSHIQSPAGGLRQPSCLSFHRCPLPIHRQPAPAQQRASAARPSLLFSLSAHPCPGRTLTPDIP
jgi:hypothetical protein